MSPEIDLIIGIGKLLCRYAVEKYLPTLMGQTMELGMSDALLSEFLVDDPVKIDERQEGRSEIIREIANPKQN